MRHGSTLIAGEISSCLIAVMLFVNFLAFAGALTAGSSGELAGRTTLDNSLRSGNPLQCFDEQLEMIRILSYRTKLLTPAGIK